LTVQVRDATGIRAGVPVRFGGVTVGEVAGQPEVGEQFTTLEIPLRIREGRRIPRGSEVRVGTSGLMGDSFIRILPPAGAPNTFYEPGETVAAGSGGSLGEVAVSAEETLNRANESLTRLGETVANLDDVLERMETGVLSDENVGNLTTLLEELSRSSERIAGASERFDPLLEETGKAAAEVQSAASSADAAFGEISRGMEDFSRTLATIEPAVKELDGALDELRVTLRSANGLIEEIEHGDGLASALLRDEELRGDLTDFADKLDRHGLLLYPREGGMLRRDEREAPREERRSAAGTRAEAPEPEGGSQKNRPFSWLKRRLKERDGEGR